MGLNPGMSGLSNSREVYGVLAVSFGFEYRLVWPVARSVIDQTGSGVNKGQATGFSCTIHNCSDSSKTASVALLHRVLTTPPPSLPPSKHQMFT